MRVVDSFLISKLTDARYFLTPLFLTEEEIFPFSTSSAETHLKIHQEYLDSHALHSFYAIFRLKYFPTVTLTSRMPHPSNFMKTLKRELNSKVSHYHEISNLADKIFDKTRFSSHIGFLSRWVRHGLIPNRFHINFHDIEPLTRKLYSIQEASRYC